MAVFGKSSSFNSCFVKPDRKLPTPRSQSASSVMEWIDNCSEFHSRNSARLRSIYIQFIMHSEVYAVYM